MEAAIEVSGLRELFRQTVAVNAISFVVSPGRVIGTVGPGGARRHTEVGAAEIAVRPVAAGSALRGVRRGESRSNRPVRGAPGTGAGGGS